MSDLNKDKLLYVPKTEPLRDYRSQGRFQDNSIFIEEEEPSTTTNKTNLIDDLKEINELIDFLPDGLSFIKDVIDIIIKRQEIIENEISNSNNNDDDNENNILNDDNDSNSSLNLGENNINDNDINSNINNNINSPNNSVTNNSNKEENTIINSNPENSYTEGSLSEEYEINNDLPDMFTEPTDINISFIPPKTLVQIAQEDYQRDTLDLNEYYLQTLQVVLQQYFQEIMTVMQECGISDLSNLIKPFDGDTVVVSNSNLVHLKDYIIRSQITREQKTRMFKKTHNVDNTLIHLRTWHAAEKERERYYTEKYGDSDTFLNSQSNALLRDCRSSYNQNYTQALYNMYKYLNSSALLIGDILTMTSKEAQAKGKLLQEGVDIFVSKETAKQQKITQQIAQYEAQQNKENTNKEENKTDTTDKNENTTSSNTTDTSNNASDNTSTEADNNKKSTETEKVEDKKQQDDEKKETSSNIINKVLNSIKEDNKNSFSIAEAIFKK